MPGEPSGALTNSISTSEGFLIAGWVSLWYPIEVLLYEWWPYSRENRIYERIMNMDIVLKAST